MHTEQAPMYTLILSEYKTLNVTEDGDLIIKCPHRHFTTLLGKQKDTPQAQDLLISHVGPP